jgi:hypothetical protein
MSINVSLELLITLYIDFVTRLLVLTKGNNTFLTLIDKITKYIKILVKKASYIVKD